MTDSEIIVLAEDFKSTSMACGVMVDDFDAVGFARAVEQASRRAALEEAAQMVERGGHESLELGFERFGRYSAEVARNIRALAASDSDGGKS